jgi:NhaP-type Na+/H+ or K+/H+ antiporter
MQRMLTYNRGMIMAGACAVIGFLLVGTLVWRYVAGGMRLAEISYPAILGLLFIILGFQTFGFTLLLEMSQRVVARNEI